VVDALVDALGVAVPDTAGDAVELALGIGLTTLCWPEALADGDGVGAGGEKVA
jgi:hypothetical protein